MKTEDIKAIFFLLISAVLWWLVWMFSDSLEGGQDTNQHYLIARWAGKYPALFLDQWGKPQFNLLAHPFTYFGINGVVFFNVNVSLWMGWLLYRTAQKLGYKSALFAPAIALLIPVYFGNVISGLTEPLNALCLSGIFYLWVHKKENAAMLLASFLPHFRSEGYIMLAVIGFYLLVNRHFAKIPLLFVGSLLIGSIGALAFKNPMWLLDTNPYLAGEISNKIISHHGSIFYYVNRPYTHLGWIPALLFPVGIVLIIRDWMTNKQSKFNSFELFMPVAIAVTYIFAHSFIYWKGMMGTHGLVRVMAVISPCFALISLKTMDRFLPRLVNKKFYVFTLFTILAISAMAHNRYLQRLWKGENAIASESGRNQFKKASDWVHTNQLDTGLVVHQLPILNMWLDLDPFDNSRTFGIWSIDTTNDLTPKGALVIWDGYHSTREGKMPGHWLVHNPAYQLIKSFEDNQDSTRTIRIFRKTK